MKLDDLQKTLGRNPYSQDVFLFGVCSREHLLDIIQNYLVYEREQGETVKKICKYQQFKAVSKLIKRISEKKTTKGRSCLAHPGKRKEPVNALDCGKTAKNERACEPHNSHRYGQN